MPCRFSGIFYVQTTKFGLSAIFFDALGNPHNIKISYFSDIVRDYRLVSYTLLVFSDHHSISSFFLSLYSFTLTLVRRAASPSRNVSFTQKPAVYPPKARIFSVSFRRSFFRLLLLIKLSALPSSHPLYTTHP